MNLIALYLLEPVMHLVNIFVALCAKSLPSPNHGVYMVVLLGGLDIISIVNTE